MCAILSIRFTEARHDPARACHRIGGFIGFHLTRRLLAEGWHVTGVDALTPYYDPALKQARLALLDHPAFRQFTGDIAEPGLVARLLAEGAGADAVFHLAAQAGCAIRWRPRPAMSMPTSPAPSSA